MSRTRRPRVARRRGPGDPALLTRKAIARLRAADLVLYDALIDDRILRYARKAQRFFVGKRAAASGRRAPRRRAMTQQTIHTVMIRAARRGRRVVRLKGGDPFVFGRGGEEALALQQAGVPFDVVPGRDERDRGARAGRHSGDAPRRVVRVSRRLRPRRRRRFASAVGQLQPNGVTLVVLMGAGPFGGDRGRR